MSSKEFEKRLKEYYNKFNEDKRLIRRHGQVEFITSMHYIKQYLETFDNPKVLDIGAGTGRYSIALYEEGYDVTAVELFKCNLNVLRAKNSNVKAYEGNALDLNFLNDDTFDLTLLFGPMYHLHSLDDCLKALNEAKRVTKPNGIIMVAYVMNDYSVITHIFKDGHYEDLNKLSEDFHIMSTEDDLYHQVRIEDLNLYNQLTNLKRIKLIAPDGPSDYIRPILNKMSEEEFNIFLKYHLATCERQDMLGASSHTLDILLNTK